MLSEVGIEKKGWGVERIHRSTHNFCLKDLIFDKAGAKCSFHYHETKREEFLVLAGSFEYTWAYGNIRSYETPKTKVLKKGDYVFIEPFTIHRMTALEDASVIQELSIADHVEDSIRVLPGDSQKVS